MAVTEPMKPVPARYQMPQRFRRALAHVTDGAMPSSFAADVGAWAMSNKSKFIRGGDSEGVYRYNYELMDVGRHWDGLAPFHKMLTDALPEACEACEVEPFDLRMIQVHATLYHHGSHFQWHDDAPGADGTLAKYRRLSFAYYLHTDPKMFSGGDLEFLDGTKVSPDNNRLVLFHPIQQHQVRPVECWSAEAIHGRWALMGWIHGDPPEGYADAIPELRGNADRDQTRCY